MEHLGGALLELLDQSLLLRREPQALGFGGGDELLEALRNALLVLAAAVGLGIDLGVVDEAPPRAVRARVQVLRRHLGAASLLCDPLCASLRPLLCCLLLGLRGSRGGGGGGSALARWIDFTHERECTRREPELNARPNSQRDVRPGRDLLLVDERAVGRAEIVKEDLACL